MGIFDFLKKKSANDVEQSNQMADVPTTDSESNVEESATNTSDNDNSAATSSFEE